MELIELNGQTFNMKTVIKVKSFSLAKVCDSNTQK